MLKWIVFTFVAVQTCASQTTPRYDRLDAPLEIALVLDGSKSVEQGNWDVMIDTVRKLPDYFVINDRATRVAVVRFAVDAELSVPLTSQEEDIRQLSLPYLNDDGTATDLAFDVVMKGAFRAVRPDAKKVAILITDGVSTDMDLAEYSAEELRDNGTFMYIAFVEKTVGADPIAKKHMDAMAGDPSNVFPIKDFQQLTTKILQQIQEKIKQRIRCVFRESCWFETLERCVAFWWRDADQNDPNCTSQEPRVHKLKCDNKTCVDLCDKWKWESVDCDDDKNAGHTIAIGREEGRPSNKPAGDQYDRCPQQKNISCPAKSSSTSKSTTQPPEVPTQVTVELASSKNNQIREQRDSLPFWMYAVIASAVSSIPAMVVIVVVVFVSRKKKRREALTAQLATEKLEKSRKGGESQRSSSASKTTQLAFEMNYGGRDGVGKDRSVLANLQGESVRKTSAIRKRTSKSEVQKSTKGSSLGPQ